MATHEELMTALKFDESFRNALRNYYSYGFKRIKDYDPQKAPTMNNDWERLNSLLYGYLKWSEDRGKDAVRFATQDSVSMEDNPFHKLYKFCKFNHSDPIAFFNIVIGLSDKLRIAGCDEENLYERLGINLKAEAKKRPYYRYIRFIKQNKKRNIELRIADTVNVLVATHDKEKKQMAISQRDVELVSAIWKIWEDTRKNIHGSESLSTIESKLYASILDEMDVDLLNDVIASVCDVYVVFLAKNAEHKIEIIKQGTKYIMRIFEDTEFSEASKNTDAPIEIPKRDIGLVERLLQEKADIAIVGSKKLGRDCIRRLGLEFLKTVFERTQKKCISFLIANIDKDIYIEKQEKKNFQLYVDEENSIVVPKKDEKYVSKLFGYWNFIKSHSDVKLSDVSSIETSKNGRNKKKKRIVLIGTTAEGNIETFGIPISNMDDDEMVKNLLAGEDGIVQYESAFLANEVSFLEDMFEIMKEAVHQNSGLLASQLQCLFPNDIGLFCGDNTAINYSLSGLENLKVIKKIASSENNKKAAENIWRLRGKTLSELLENGSDIFSNEETDFETAFYSAIDFYSRYYVLGICGSFIKDRMNRLGTAEKSAFRFKHEYFMQSLNDFNLIDLLYVIENDKWCEIRYSHGTAGFSSKILCKPLEVRISSTSGREFLVFYNPIKRSCTNLRLEFIEDIIAYEEVDVLKALEKNSISRYIVDADLANSRESLKYMWGVSFSSKQDGNAIVPVEAEDVKLTIEYDDKKEYFIRNRILRESRGTIRPTGVSIQPDKGIISFGARVSDPKEMRPWIRSLYSRLLSVEGVETETFSVLEDVEKYINGIGDFKEEKRSEPVRWADNAATLGRIPNGEKVRIHELLFNEVFGVYYYIIAEIILICCSVENRTSMPKRQIDDIVKKVENWYKNKGGRKTFKLSMKEVYALLNTNAFGQNFEIHGEKRTRFQYACDSEIEFYKDVLPLTILEVRWLKSIISDSNIYCFFNSKQIEFINTFLEEAYPDVKSLPSEYLIFYDRYIVDQPEKDRERSYLYMLVEAIRNERLVCVTYKTNSGNLISKTYKPIVVEYSKRNNKFQAQLQACDNNRYDSVNLSQIDYVEIKEEFDHAQTLKEYEAHRKNKEHPVVIQFFDVRNMADRILTEFSPWRKFCVYDPETNMYTLTLYYNKDEELDLVVRLMGYGNTIHFVDKEHSIAREILYRYTMQRNMLLEKQKNVERGNE